MIDIGIYSFISNVTSDLMEYHHFLSNCSKYANLTSYFFDSDFMKQFKCPKLINLYFYFCT